MSQIIDSLIRIAAENILLLSILLPVIGGEIGIITLSFIATQLDKYFFLIFLITNIIVLIMDSAWFFAFKQFKINKLMNFSKNYVKLEKHIQKISANKDALIIFISKL